MRRLGHHPFAGFRFFSDGLLVDVYWICYGVVVFSLKLKRDPKFALPGCFPSPVPSREFSGVVQVPGLVHEISLVLKPNPDIVYRHLYRSPNTS